MEAEPLVGVLPDSMEKTVPSVRPSASVASRVPVMVVSSAPVSYTHLTLPTNREV